MRQLLLKKEIERYRNMARRGIPAMISVLNDGQNLRHCRPEQERIQARDDHAFPAFLFLIHKSA
jgi:hypothetical protein